MRDSTTPRAGAPAEGAALTKTEALRRAIAALGYRAPVTEILAYVGEHYGIGATSAPTAPPPAPPEPSAADEAKKAPLKRGKK